MDEVRFNHKPYQVIYKDQHTGELKKIMRRPPEKLHDILPTDIVKLNQRKSADFEEDGEYKVKHISPRSPNVLQLKNDDGQTTFVEYFQTDLQEKVAYRSVAAVDDEVQSRYLLWP